MKTATLPNDKLCDGRFRPIVLKCTEIDEKNRYDTAALLARDISHGIKNRGLDSLLPGFRSGKKLYKNLTVAYIIFFAFMLYVGFDMYDTALAKLGNVLFVFFIFGAPIIILTNTFNWLDRFPPTKEQGKGSRLGWQGLFIFLSMIAAYGFIILTDI